MSGHQARGYALPLATLMAIQLVMTLATYSLPVVIPVAAADLGIAPESIGFLISLVYLLGMAGGLLTGVLIARFGVTGVFQGLLSLTILAMGILWSSLPTSAIACAIVLGCAGGPMNPAGSHVLAPVVPLRQRSFIFSVKQCATPGGGIVAGILLPPLMLSYGWQNAILIIPLIASMLLVLIPFGRLGHRPLASASSESSIVQVVRAIKLTLSDRAIRAVTFTGVALAIGQMGSATYLVVYLWREVGFSEAAAGLVFAVFHLSGVLSRLVLGALADRFVSARWALVSVCAVLAISLIITSQFTAAWPVTLVYAVTVLTGASGNGWVGLYFSELARLAPPDKVAEVAGGSQFFTYAGLVAGPLLFGTLLRLSGSYEIAFFTLAAIAMVAAIGLSRATIRRN